MSATGSRPTARCRWSWCCRRPSAGRACCAIAMPQGQGCAARRRHLASGGALPLADGDSSWHGQFNKVLESTTPIAASSRSPASPISASPRPCRADGFYYAPDPSSQIACTDRRQHRREFRRRALPEVWPDHQQPARVSRWCPSTARSSAWAASTSTPAAMTCWA